MRHWASLGSLGSGAFLCLSLLSASAAGAHDDGSGALTDRRIAVSDPDLTASLKRAAEAVGVVRSEFPQSSPPTFLDTSETGSGVLIAPCLVLTARHVLGLQPIDASSGRTIKVSFFQYKSDGSRISFMSEAKVRSNGGGRGRWSNLNVVDDWAILELTTPPKGIIPISLEAINCCGSIQARRIALVGFPADRFNENEPVAWLDPNCRVAQRLANGMLVTTCLATSGNSGGPLLMQVGDRWVLGGLLTRAAPPDALGRAQNTDNFALPFGNYLRREIRNAQSASACPVSQPPPLPALAPGPETNRK